MCVTWSSIGLKSICQRAVEKKVLLYFSYKMFSKLIQVDIYVYKLWALKSQLPDPWRSQKYISGKTESFLHAKICWQWKFLDSSPFRYSNFSFFMFWLRYKSYYRSFLSVQQGDSNFLKLYSIYNYCKILAGFLAL